MAGIQNNQLEDDVVVVKRSIITLNNAEILALPTTPMTIIVAQGAGVRAGGGQ